MLSENKGPGNQNLEENRANPGYQDPLQNRPDPGNHALGEQGVLLTRIFRKIAQILVTRIRSKIDRILVTRNLKTIMRIQKLEGNHANPGYQDLL